jgi:hypothetical protein
LPDLDITDSFEILQGIIFGGKNRKQVTNLADLFGRGDLRLSGRPENSAARNKECGD